MITKGFIGMDDFTHGWPTWHQTHSVCAWGKSLWTEPQMPVTQGESMRPQRMCTLVVCGPTLFEVFVVRAFLYPSLKQLQTHTHTHTPVLVTPLPRLGYVDTINGVSQQVATRPVVLLAAETPALSPQLHALLGAVGVLIYGLAKPMR